MDTLDLTLKLWRTSRNSRLGVTAEKSRTILDYDAFQEGEHRYTSETPRRSCIATRYRARPDGMIVLCAPVHPLDDGMGHGDGARRLSYTCRTLPDCACNLSEVATTKHWRTQPIQQCCILNPSQHRGDLDLGHGVCQSKSTRYTR